MKIKTLRQLHPNPPATIWRDRNPASVLQQAEELPGSVAHGADIRRLLAFVDIPADDAFPALRHRGKLYQTAAHSVIKCSAGGRSPPRGYEAIGDFTALYEKYDSILNKMAFKPVDSGF
jgi:hypothetical protein